MKMCKYYKNLQFSIFINDLKRWAQGDLQRLRKRRALRLAFAQENSQKEAIARLSQQGSHMGFSIHSV